MWHPCIRCESKQFWVRLCPYTGFQHLLYVREQQLNKGTLIFLKIKCSELRNLLLAVVKGLHLFPPYWRTMGSREGYAQSPCDACGKVNFYDAILLQMNTDLNMQI